MTKVKLLAWRGNDKKLNKKQVKQVSKIVNKSKKYKMSFGKSENDTTLSSPNITEIISQSGSQGLDNITEGTESYQRQGDTIMLKHYEMMINAYMLRPLFQETATDVNSTANTFRIVVARLFGIYSGTPGDYFTSIPMRLAQWIVEKGTVVYDKVHVVATSPDNRPIKIKIPCKTKKIPHILVQYNDDDPVGVEKNDIRVFVFASNSTANIQYISYAEHIGYYDKY